MTFETNPAERDAIARLKHGDIEGLSVLVRLYQVQAVRTAYLITHDRILAEDVVQTTFIRAYQYIDQYDAERPFAPWFLRCVANEAVQAARRARRDLSLDDEVSDDGTTFADLLAGAGPGPDEALAAADLRQAVWAALQQLSPQQRSVVVLRYYVGLSEAELAAELDVPPGTIKWRLYAARKRLGVLLGPFAGLK